jgi:hypothetical protein
MTFGGLQKVNRENIICILGGVGAVTVTVGPGEYRFGFHGLILRLSRRTTLVLVSDIS